MNIVNNQKEIILQFCYECLLNAKYAVKGYSEYKNIVVAIQFINQSFQCIKLAHFYYVQSFEPKEIQYLEDFIHQYGILNQEFLNALQSESDLQWAHIELENLEKIFKELKGLLV